MPRFGRLGRGFAALSFLGVTALSVDDYYNSHRVQRNLRALYTTLRIIYEYKMHWDQNHPIKQNEAVHRRAAELILHCCQKNGGLYVKFGQGIASMNHILPKQYREVFEVLHDKAPFVPYRDVRRIIIEDLKVDPNVIFSEFDETPVASASVAQVHRAKLHSGETVAVKVQKPYIADQVPWDLACYRIMLHGIEWAFDLPLIWSTDFTERQMLTETDFVSEAMNAQKSSQLLNHEKYIFDYPNKLQRRKSPQKSDDDYQNTYIKNDYLKSKIYVPKLFPAYCSKRILTAEWCDGAKVNDIEKIQKMGFDFRDIMHTVVALFGYQIFVTGVVHCDPHPGNLLVRQKPGTSGRNNYELVFLDHGLYLEEPATFRKEYSQFWTAMFLSDMNTLNQIGEKWGVRDVEFFASVQLIKPFSSKKGGVVDTKTLSKKDLIEMQLLAKKRAQKVLQHTRTIPRHLLFVGRNMNIVRANNKDLGSPVNRVGILAEYAAKGASLIKSKGRFYYYHYKMNTFGLSVYYQWKSNWKSVNDFIFGENSKVTSFEEDIENQMAQFAKDMGLVVEAVDNDMFDA